MEKIYKCRMVPDKVTSLIFFILLLFFGVSLAVEANNYDLSKFSKQRDLLTFNGFIENKGQIVDQDGSLNKDVLFLFKDKNFKCIRILL